MDVHDSSPSLHRPRWMGKKYAGLYEALCALLAEREQPPGRLNWLNELQSEQVATGHQEALRSGLEKMLANEQVRYACDELRRHRFDDKGIAGVLRLALVALNAEAPKMSTWRAMIARQRADATTLREIAQRNPVIAPDLRERADFLDYLAEDADPAYPHFQRKGRDDKTRIAAVLVAMHIRAHCGDLLCGTVATLVSSVTGNESITEDTVRCWMKATPRS